mgnify:CR=1 FL=1
MKALHASVVALCFIRFHLAHYEQVNVTEIETSSLRYNMDNNHSKLSIFVPHHLLSYSLRHAYLPFCIMAFTLNYQL